MREGFLIKKVVLLLFLAGAGLVGLAAAFPEDATRAAFAIERFRSGLTHETLVVDGETWHYLHGGPEDASVILLLHGFGGDKDNWTRFAATLTDQYRVIAPDLPGFGESARHGDWDYSLTAQSERIGDFATALNLGQFHIGGNSMGGQLAGLYVHEHADQVRSLALLNNGGINAPEPSEVWSAVMRGENPLIITAPEDFDRLVSLVAHKQPFIPWPAKDVLAQRAYDNAAFNDFIFAALKDDRYVGLEPLLPDIRQPVLIIWGEHDRVLDVSSIDVMQPLIPQAKVVIMPDTGHIPMIERPQETARHYLEFLGEN